MLRPFSAKKANFMKAAQSGASISFPRSFPARHNRVCKAEAMATFRPSHGPTGLSDVQDGRANDYAEQFRAGQQIGSISPQIA
jgi:hypothetical protein